MSNPRIRKKIHNRYVADFLIEFIQDDVWKQKLLQLSEDKALAEATMLDTALEGMPDAFAALFPGPSLHYCIEALEWGDVPRKVSRGWPDDASSRYFMCYPFEFPGSPLYLSIDL